MPIAPAAPALATPAPATDPLDSLRPRPLSSGAEDAGEFVVFDDVAVFDAHTGDDGVVYDDKLLAAIAENNNRRIRDTGDFVPLVIGHTPENPDSDRDPPVVGMAGPFRVGTLGQEKPRPCIFAKFWVWKDKLKEFRAHPRRSVELWPEEAPEQRYFDPIALLGATTSRRDLGLVYSKPRGIGQQPIRYELGGPSAPSGSNTFLPSIGGEDKPEKHNKGTAMPYSPEDIGQLIEALKPTIATLVSEAIQAVQNPEPDLSGIDDPAAPPAGADPAAAAPPAAPSPVAGPAAPPAADPLAGAAAALPPDGPAADEEPPADEDEPARYQEHCDPMTMSDTDPAAAGAVEKYKKQRDGWKLRYQKSEAARQKAESELAAAKKHLGESLKRERYAKRLGQAYELKNEGYILEPEEEVEDHMTLSDDQWDSHLARARVRYQKVPLGTIPTPPDPALDFATREKHNEYAEKAQKVALRYQKDPTKRHIRYLDVLKHLHANKGVLDESRLLQEAAR